MNPNEWMTDNLDDVMSKMYGLKALYQEYTLEVRHVDSEHPARGAYIYTIRLAKPEQKGSGGDAA